MDCKEVLIEQMQTLSNWNKEFSLNESSREHYINQIVQNVRAIIDCVICINTLDKKDR